MTSAEKVIGKIERTTLGLNILATDLKHITELIEEQTRLLALYRDCAVSNAAQLAEIEALERGYEGMDSGVYTLTAIRLFEGLQGIANHFIR